MMTIFDMASQAGFNLDHMGEGCEQSLIKLAALVRAQALEEAAVICDGIFDPDWPGDVVSVQALECASAIRSIK